MKYLKIFRANEGSSQMQDLKTDDYHPVISISEIYPKKKDNLKTADKSLCTNISNKDVLYNNKTWGKNANTQ